MRQDRVMEIEYARGIPFRLASQLLAMPDPLIQRFAGDPIEVDGRTLNRSVQLLLAISEKVDRNALVQGSVEQRREELSKVAALGMPRARHLHVVASQHPGS